MTSTMGFIQNIFARKKSLSAIARKTGYVRDQMGIQNRFLRENQQWQSHLQNTKQYIIDYMQQLPSKTSAAVLGSGWLLDVPIDELAQTFQHVYLFDIVHPEQITVRMRKYPNVHLVECDLTGGIVGFAEESKIFADFLEKMPSAKLSVDCQNYDAVFSVNILNQLDILLCDYLKEKFSVGETELSQVRKFVQQFHIDNLPIGKTCLITDYAEENIGVEDSLVGTKKLLYCTLPPSKQKQEWLWNFDSNQKYHSGKNTKLKVQAIQF